jgi:hypothetical protein
MGCLWPKYIAQRNRVCTVNKTTGVSTIAPITVPGIVLCCHKPVCFILCCVMPHRWRRRKEQALADQVRNEPLNYVSPKLILQTISRLQYRPDVSARGARFECCTSCGPLQTRLKSLDWTLAHHASKAYGVAGSINTAVNLALNSY